MGNDETIIVRSFANNEEDWVLGRLATEEIQDADGKRYAYTRKYYDGEAFFGLDLGEIARGEVTREEAWVGPDPNDFEVVTSTRYDDQGLPVETRDGRGGGRLFEWADDRTHLLSETVKLDSGVELREVAETDGAFGNLVAVTAYNGETTRYRYDAFGRLSEVIKPGDSAELPTISYSYEVGAPLSRVITESRVRSGEEELERSEAVFDGLGRKRGTFTRDGERWLWAGASLLDERGKARRELLPRWATEDEYAEPPILAGGRGSDTWFDASGRPVRTKSAMGVETRKEYGPYEERSWDGGQSDSDSEYEGTPSVVRKDGRGRVVAHERTLNGEVLSAVYELDAADRMVARTDPEDNRQLLSYDGRGRLITVEDPDLGVHRMAHDSTGNLIRHEHPDGKATSYTFDLAGRTLTEDWDDDGDPEITYQYDEGQGEHGRGKLLRVTEPSGSIEHTYDARGRITSTRYEIDGETFVVRSQFDAQDREVLHVYPDGSSIELRRNGRGQLEGYGDAITFEYGDDGLETSRSFNTGVEITSEHDDDGRQIGMHARAADGTTLEHLAWTYDSAGNVTRIQDLRPDIDEDRDRSEDYRYDNLYRLVGASGTWGEAWWEYSPTGNLLSRESTVSELEATGIEYGERPHAMTAINGRTVEYDKRGRIVSDGTRTYEWDGADQLKKVERDGATTESVYGLDGVRRLRRERKTDGSTKTTRFIDAWSEHRDGKLVRYIVHSGQRIVRLSEDNGVGAVAGPVSGGSTGEESLAKESSLSARVVSWLLAVLLAVVGLLRGLFASAARWRVLGARGLMLGGALAALLSCSDTSDGPSGPDRGSVRELSSADTILLSDLIGSLLGESDGVGTPKAEHAVYPYGLTRYDDSSETNKYAGNPRDGVVGLDHMGSRFYAAELGVWTSGDPVAITSPNAYVGDEFGAANPYAYANLRPVIAADRDGQFWHIAAGAALGAVVGGGIEAIRQYATTGKVEDWGRVGAAAAGGAVSGAVTAANPAVGLAGVMTVGAASGAAGGVTERLVASGGKDAGTITDVLVDAAVGAATAGVVKGASAALKKIRPPRPPAQQAPVNQVKSTAGGSGSQGGSIATPYGAAEQSSSTAATEARTAVQEGATLYRGGTLGRSAGPEGQFWSLENPLNPGYAAKYGIPEENQIFDFLETATLRPGAPFITREAPGVGANGGGGIEVVVDSGGVALRGFFMQ